MEEKNLLPRQKEPNPAIEGKNIYKIYSVYYTHTILPKKIFDLSEKERLLP